MRKPVYPDLRMRDRITSKLADLEISPGAALALAREVAEDGALPSIDHMTREALARFDRYLDYLLEIECDFLAFMADTLSIR